jgi:uncharacterized Zn-binding protein involved in type VI secretion
VNQLAAVRVGDIGIGAACCGPGIWTADHGSATVFINGQRAVRSGDATRHCGGVGAMIKGSADVNTC